MAVKDEAHFNSFALEFIATIIQEEQDFALIISRLSGFGPYSFAFMSGADPAKIGGLSLSSRGTGSQKLCPFNK